MINSIALYKIRDVIRKHLSQEEVKEAFLFGSGEVDNNDNNFNYAIGVSAKRTIPNYKFEVIKDELSTSNIAYNVEITDISKSKGKSQVQYKSPKLKLI